MRDVIYTPHRSRLMGVTMVKEVLHSLTFDIFIIPLF